VQLHTLRMPHTWVSADGFDTVRQNSELLPRLRIMTYRNVCYEEGLEEFFCMTPDELATGLEEDLLECKQNHRDFPTLDWNGYLLLPELAIRDFYAFCALVVARGLIVPSERHKFHALPKHEHRLSRDYFGM
jgi:hypothetical protein